MAKVILLEEFHVSVYAPRDLPEVRYDAMRRALDAPPFRIALGKAVREAARRFTDLADARLRVSR